MINGKIQQQQKPLGHWRVTCKNNLEETVKMKNLCKNSKCATLRITKAFHIKKIKKRNEGKVKKFSAKKGIQKI